MSWHKIVSSSLLGNGPTRQDIDTLYIAEGPDECEGPHSITRAFTFFTSCIHTKNTIKLPGINPL